MIGDLFSDADSAIRGSAALVGVAAAVSSLEWLSLSREMGERGPFAWKVAGSRPVLLRHPRLEAAVARVCRPPAVTALNGLRALAGVALVATAVGGVTMLPALAVLCLTGLVALHRDPSALDGSDQMIAIVVLALTLGELAGAQELAAAFIGAQAVASYFIAGVAKLRGPEWRQGAAVPRILSTRAYGLPALGVRLWEHRRVGRAVTWSAMSFEVLFPLALIGPKEALIAFIATGFLFHVGNAVAMGLNVFLWAFAATYPCVIWLAQQV